MQSDIGQSDMDGVEGLVEYVSPEARHSLRYIGNGREVNTARFDRHKVFVRNARPEAESLRLDTSGFELRRHESRIDFYDQAGAEADYPREIEDVLREATGADHIVLFGPRRRHSAASAGHVLPAATDVHVDFAAPFARRMARQMLDLVPDAPMPYRRYMEINIWRSLSPPPQDRPLALCDGRSVLTQSGVENTAMRVDEVPPVEERLTEPPNDPSLGQGWVFHYDPAHRWYYYPEMTRDEILLFKLYDSAETGPWRCPHVSFVDPTVKAAPARESFELRSFVYFR